MQPHLARLDKICELPRPFLAFFIYSGLCIATFASALGHLGAADPGIMGIFAALAGIGVMLSVWIPSAKQGVPLPYQQLTLLPFVGMRLGLLTHPHIHPPVFERLR